MLKEDLFSPGIGLFIWQIFGFVVIVYITYLVIRFLKSNKK